MKYCMYLYGHAIKADVVVVFGSNLTCLFRYFTICHNFWSFCVVLFSAARCPIQHFVGALVCLAILSKFLLPQRGKLLFLFYFIFFFFLMPPQFKNNTFFSCECDVSAAPTYHHLRSVALL